MRILIILAFVFAIVLITSCSKDAIDDFTKPENISGTTWKCSTGSYWNEDLEYALLIFKSTKAVEGWTKLKDKAEQKDLSGTFSISNNKISFVFDEESFTGIIEGKTMKITNDGTFIFLKQ